LAGAASAPAATYRAHSREGEHAGLGAVHRKNNPGAQRGHPGLVHPDHDGLVLVDVTSRYVLNDPLSIAEEYGGYLLVTVTCMGLAYAWKERGHVRVEFLIAAFPRALQKWVRLGTLLLAFVFTGFMTIAAWELVETSFMFGTRSGSWLRTPIAYPQMVIIVGSAWMFLQLIAELIKAIRSEQSGSGG
jgi:TRAP-type C4-dicarboxylate transport system permease small subunit